MNLYYFLAYLAFIALFIWAIASSSMGESDNLDDN